MIYNYKKKGLFFKYSWQTLRVICPFSTKVRDSPFRNKKQNEVLLFLQKCNVPPWIPLRDHSWRVKITLAKNTVTQIVLKGQVSEPDEYCRLVNPTLIAIFSLFKVGREQTAIYNISITGSSYIPCDSANAHSRQLLTAFFDSHVGWKASASVNQYLTICSEASKPSMP